MRVGRGESSGKGKTCGRGNKGQMSRSGHKHKAGFEGGQMRFLMRIPKRGFTHPGARIVAPVNIGVLARFEAGAVVDAAALQAAGIIKSAKATVKILGQGELDRKLTVKANGFSAGARAKIEAAGGTCEVV
jgi:large subunit ribosomal protein L15